MFKRCLLILVMAQEMPALAALQDPTRPPTQAAASVSSPTTSSGPRWVLTSMLVSPERRTAVINDQVVGIGDRVGGARVMDIQADAVRLRAEGREVTLVMLKTNVKKSVKSPVQNPGRSSAP